MRFLDGHGPVQPLIPQPVIVPPAPLAPVSPVDLPWSPITPNPGGPPILLSPEQLAQLLKAFHASAEAAKVADAVTGQKECVDPEKAKLEARVAELERLLVEMGKRVEKLAEVITIHPPPDAA